MEALNPDSYPIHAFPTIIKNAILHAQVECQAPLALIASSALGAISLACQNSIDIQCPTGIESPVSLYFLTIAESGERKTSVDKIFTRPIRDFEESQAAASMEKLTRFEAELKTWEIKHKVILSAIKKATQEFESTEQMTQTLADHIAKSPSPPKFAKLVYDDTTPEALKYSLHSRWSSAGLISDEAGSIFNGHAMRNLEMINTLWSGGKLQVDRRNSESFVVRDARLSISLMIQENTLGRYILRRGSEARDSGLLARFLVAKPTSTQGTRFFQSRSLGCEDIPVFQKRILAILEENLQMIDQGAPNRVLLKFSTQATVRWTTAYNRIENDMNPGSDLASIKDYGAKFAENIARLAALLHYFEGCGGDISYEMVDRAAEICTWYTRQFRQMFSSESREQQDVEKFDLWLASKYQQYNISRIKMNEVRQTCPNALRKDGRLDQAMRYFVANDLVRILQINGTNFVALNPDYFNFHKHWSSRNNISHSSLSNGFVIH